MVGRGIPYWNGSFLGDMLFFGVVFDFQIPNWFVVVQQKLFPPRGPEGSIVDAMVVPCCCKRLGPHTFWVFLNVAPGGWDTSSQITKKICAWTSFFAKKTCYMNESNVTYMCTTFFPQKTSLLYILFLDSFWKAVHGSQQGFCFKIYARLWTCLKMVISYIVDGIQKSGTFTSWGWLVVEIPYLHGF